MNTHRLKILVLGALIAILANIALPPKPAKAFLNPYFGGFIIAHVPPTLICPDILVVFDYATFSPVRLYFTPASIIFPNFNVFTPGTWVKGTDIPIPFPTCPGLTSGAVLMIGTS